MLDILNQYHAECHDVIVVYDRKCPKIANAIFLCDNFGSIFDLVGDKERGLRTRIEYMLDFQLSLKIKEYIEPEIWQKQESDPQNQTILLLISSMVWMMALHFFCLKNFELCLVLYYNGDPL